MSRLALLSTTDAVDPLPLARLGPPVRHAEERRAALLADPSYRRREAEKAFEQRHYPTPDGQTQYTIQAATLDAISADFNRAALHAAGELRSDGLVPVSLDELLKQIKSFEQDRAAVMKKPATPDRAAVMKKPATPDRAAVMKKPATPGADKHTQRAAALFCVEYSAVTPLQRQYAICHTMHEQYRTAQTLEALQYASEKLHGAKMAKKPTAPVASPKSRGEPARDDDAYEAAQLRAYVAQAKD